MSTRGRIVQNNATVIDQPDFFQSDGFTRLSGLTPSQLTLQLFFNNAIQPWGLVDGTTVPDAQVASGNVYFNEIPGSAGFYNVRFRPIGVGYWRVILTYTSVPQIQAQDYDVVNNLSTPTPGLVASFMKPPR
jgi:hypothetical protein